MESPVGQRDEACACKFPSRKKSKELDDNNLNKNDRKAPGIGSRAQHWQ